ncbi:Dimodular nonribosomal peptide synthase [Enhygromyxa salina]|uniref:Dimodular nonribosomal peptide synthase n=1 Tax=Enhygromyxa salina TaxID=215803 RepID=A0A2S9YBE8_9BACT|nr:non-ribosomal peptide synthetase [Enhygromyxa salina]PRQ02447.1 Dimodular nonribosomal peptide synthase [Enhygromyxa salina]
MSTPSMNTPTPNAPTLNAQFAAVSVAAAERIGVQLDEQTWTYAALGRWVGQVAGVLAQAGVGPGDRVGLALPRGAEAIVAMLAVTQLGAAFIPLPLDWPAARVAFVIDDASPSLVLGAPGSQAADRGPTRWRSMPDFNPGAPSADPADPAAGPGQATPTSLACMLYTSGSTGQPKGVCLEHAALLTRLQWMWQAWPWGPADRSLHRSSLGFIDAITESLAPLLCGAGVVILPQRDSADVLGMLALIQDQGLTRVSLVPSLVRQLLDLGGDVSRLPPRSVWVVSGERFEHTLLTRLRHAAPELTILNLYGCTEVTGDATCAVFEPGDALPPERVPIGRAIAGARVHVLDPHGQVVAPGVVGELYVGGPLLARGYHHRPEEQQARFVDDAGLGRLFRTGDLGQELDGEFHYAGRVDSQVKLRGVRIELGEVEATLAEVLAGEVVVVVASQPPRLVAFTTDTRADLGAALAHAARRLPPAAVPATISVVDEIPLTPSGKRDRIALEARCASQSARAAGPKTPLERELASMLALSLGCSEVDREHSLATCGGDSLTTAAFLTRLRERFGLREVEPGWLRSQSVAALAEWFGSRSESGSGSESGAAPSPNPRPKAKPTPSRWDIQAATLAERDALALLSTSVFVEREILSQLCGLRADDLSPYAGAVVDQSLAERLAWTAVERETGQRVGFCLAHDFTAQLNPASRPAMGPTLALLGELMRRYEAQRGSLGPGEVAEIAMTGALARIDGLEVAHALETHALHNITRAGFSSVVTICTHPATVELAEQLGFSASVGVRMQDFTWHGERLFAERAGPDVQALLYERKL